jgi:type II secretory ATPase GspE/PulE/Tfp pilus assembly ATPase PilB-like protein
MARKKSQPNLPPPIMFEAAGADDQQRQTNLIQSRQAPGFPFACELLADALLKRSEAILLDYTRDAVAVRYQIDGMWHNLPPRDRQSGDAMLAVLKKLADLNFNERRARQQGKFEAGFLRKKFKCNIISQGTKTGERVVLKMADKKHRFESLEQLGMRDKMQEQLLEALGAKQGLIVISSMPEGGLTTTWNVALSSTDRFTRDFVLIEAEGDDDDEIINVEPVRFKPADGETPDTKLPTVLLKQPDVVLVPDLTNAKTVELVCRYVLDEKKLAIVRTRSRDAAEALLRILAYEGPARELAECLTLVLNQRLIRKLCENCRQPFQPPPQLLQKLGIPPGRVKVMYQEFRPPPPEQQVDERGRPIEIPLCPKCGGLGYFGKTGIFELLTVDDKLRDALQSQPRLEVLRQAARAGGHRTLQEEGIVLVARGVTSITELQRVMKQ